MKKVSIIGFGRFGKTLYRLLENDFEITLFDPNQKTFKDIKLQPNTKTANTLAEVYESETIFFCVPISAFETVIKQHKKYFKEQLLIDVLSVKVHPEKVLKKHLKNTKTTALLTHPMFGPDSARNGFKDLALIMHKFLATQSQYTFWKNYFNKKGLRIVEMTAKEHDRLAAKSQGITHFIGRLLEQAKLVPTPIDTTGAKLLQEVKTLTCNDTWQLFEDLQQYNPYTKGMRTKFGSAYDQLYNKILPKRVNPKYITYGIQGGIGSFNEEALSYYTQEKKVKNFKIKYLFTTPKVLNNLHKGNIDFGLFAIQNSVGGMVQESINAMAKYKFEIVEEISIPIRHHLMKHKDIEPHKIKTIMAHPQVLKQCKSTLAQKYPKIKLTSGKGDLLDTAKAARALSKRQLPPTTAILGPEALSKLYDLEIIANNLQDDRTNDTCFLLVSR